LRKLADDGHTVVSCVLASKADARHARPELERLNEVAARAADMVGIVETVRFEFPNIQLNVVPHLEMVRAIESVIERVRPEWIFTHHPGDLNIDHRECYEATMAALMLPQRLSRDLPPTLVRRVYLFEVLSSTDWALAPQGNNFQPNAFFDIRDTLDVKVRALREFEGAMKPYPHSRSEETVRALARVRGAAVGIEYAEAFCLVREVNV
jgi:LmbE family N-acetylglucosaminyl deacetylase